MVMLQQPFFLCTVDIQLSGRWLFGSARPFG